MFGAFAWATVKFIATMVASYLINAAFARKNNAHGPEAVSDKVCVFRRLLDGGLASIGVW